MNPFILVLANLPATAAHAARYAAALGRPLGLSPALLPYQLHPLTTATPRRTNPHWWRKRSDSSTAAKPEP